ncbi:MAG TPA: hypothetical protein VF544_09645 [Pyrinomonadaceae bacterium]|jgi:hypothetical protein
MQTDYQYYADGSLRFAHDLADERFDRAYSYDEMGRVKDAFSGSEARDFIFQTQTPSPSGPYRQTYTYNVWGEMTGRQNRYWSKWDNFGASYVNGRNTDPLWQYNADGTLKQDKDLSYKYDAAGSNTEVRQIDNTVINSQLADADGQVIKRVEQNLNVSRSATTTYYVRSTVLDGRVIAEVNASREKQKRNIYLGEEVLASEGVGGAISWKHEDALTGGSGVSVSGGGYAPIAEYDASGVNVGLEAPSAGPLFKAETPTLIDSNGGAGGMRCTVDGLVMDCDWVRQLEANGAAAQCPNNDCGPQWRYNPATEENEWRFFRSFADGRQGYVPLGATSDGKGGITLPNGDEGFGYLAHASRQKEVGNPNCFVYAVQGSSNPGIARGYTFGHDGPHSRGPGNVVALPAMEGATVKYITSGDTSTAAFNSIVDISLKGRKYVVLLKDLGNLRVGVGETIKAGQRIGSVNGGTKDGFDMLKGLHFSLIRAEYYDEYRNLTPHTVSTKDPKYKAATETINNNLQKWFVDPLSAESPFNCPGFHTRIDYPILNGKPTEYPIP